MVLIDREGCSESEKQKWQHQQQYQHPHQQQQQHFMWFLKTATCTQLSTTVTKMHAKQF